MTGATIRLRGQSTLWFPKRSFRIGLDRATIDGRDRLKLLAEQSADSRLWQLTAYDLFERMGSLASHARPVLAASTGRCSAPTTTSSTSATTS